MGDVEAFEFLVEGDPQQVQPTEREEEKPGQGARPGRDRHHARELVPEKGPGAPVEDPTAVAVQAVVGQQADRDDPPHPAEEVYGGGVERVVDSEPLEPGSGIVVDEPGDAADHDGRVRLHHVAPGGDPDEAAEDPVECRREVQRVVVQGVEEQPRRPARGGRQRGGDADAGRGAHGTVAERRDAVEAVPPKPQDESSKHCEDRRVTGHVRVPGPEAKAAVPCAYEYRTHQGSPAACHVNDP
mmetsp:Transcript_6332/g.15207  ORF Transcript_6332/g.15207 Transcript_6332/m.15207 type:complete len:242 (+) Transcript_6332:475-1200(+)